MDRHLELEKTSDGKDKSGNSRNGYNKKKLQSQFGEIEIRIPRDRKGEFEPRIIGKYQTKTEHLEDQIIEMYAKGMSNREIEAHLRDIYGVCASASLVSKITDKTMPDAVAWQNRPLDPVYPIVIFDGIIIKARSEGRVIDKRVYSALGINTKGYKEILGMWITEMTDTDTLFWSDVLGDLRRRGASDILIACRSSLPGFFEAMKSIFPETEQQLCVMHHIRNSIKDVTSNDSEAIMADLKLIYGAGSLNEATRQLEEFRRLWNQKYPAITECWDASWDELTTYFKFPAEVRKLIYTTNASEGFHRMLRRFTKNKTAYPTDDAVRKSIYLSVREISKKWSTPLKGWDKVMGQLKMYFKNRLTY
jgi:putative transposase